ncbi:MAG: amidohydrolase family protein [Stellaceae bacterium]
MAVFDMDSHLREEYFLDEVYRLGGKFAHLTPQRLAHDRNVGARFKHELSPWPREVAEHFNHAAVYDENANWNGGEVARRQVGGYDMARRIADNDREGVDVQFLFPTQLSIPTYAEGELGSALCRAYNDWVKRLVTGYEARLWPVGVVPWGHPEGMAAELRHCVRELGFRAIHLTPYTHRRTIDNAVFEPFYEAAEAMDVPLMLHPNSYGELINRYDNFFAMHVLGRPLNCTAGLVALVTGGVFERHPKLRAAFFECSAEWILYWMHRMDDDWKRLRNGFAPKISRTPSDYIRQNCYVTCEADERLLAHALTEFSEDRVLLATDYPHFDSEYPGTVRELLGRTDITARQKDKIVSGNASEFLHL